RRDQRLAQEVVAGALQRPQPSQFLAECGLLGTQLLEMAGARRRIHLQQRIEQGGQLKPALGVHCRRWLRVPATTPAGTAAPSASRGGCCARSASAARRSPARSEEHTFE